MSEFGFHRFEGFLGESVSMPKILFLFREPNTKKVEEDEKFFWFKKVLNNEEKGTRYRNVLNRMTYRILYPENEYTDACTNLKECAYMNLRPDGGEAKASSEFYMVLDAFKELSIEKNESVLNLDTLVWGKTDAMKKMTAQKIAQDRMNIIHNLTERGIDYIVTTEDIYDVIRMVWERDNKEKCKQNEYYGPFSDDLNNVKCYHYCDIGQTRLISFAHPSNPQIKYSVLEKMKIWP